jgi:type II secretory pathway component PulC
MQRLKYFFRSINLLNLILLTIIVLILYTIFPSFKMQLKYSFPSIKKSLDNQEEKLLESRAHIMSPSDYMLISEENLFHPERRIPPEKKVEQPLPKPEFVLYGTLITNDTGFAYLEDAKEPRSTPGRGKRQITLEKGDTLNGFNLKEVKADSIVMARGEEKMTIYVYNRNNPKKRESIAPTSAVPKVPQQPAAKTPPVQTKPALSQSTTKQQQLPSKSPEQMVLPPQSPEEQSIVNFLEGKRK